MKLLVVISIFLDAVLSVDVQNPLLKPPTNVRAVYNSEDMIVIHWEPPDTSIPVIKYTVSCHVARDADLSVQLQRVTGLSNSASFSGLQPMTSYSIGVSAQYDNTEFRKAGVMTASTRLNVSDDVDCKCNVEGTVNQTFCYDVTKQCWCWEGFTGQHCNKCAAYHYSPYATKECKPCPCLLDHSSGRCYMAGSGSVKCQHCRSGYRGDLCQDCDTRTHYADGSDCSLCDCSGNGVLVSGSMCDDMTGWCLKCANHTRGSSCEVCDVGYAGNPAAGIPCVLAEAMSVDGSTPGILAGIVVMCSIFVVLVGGFVYYKRRDGMQRQNPYYTIELKDDYVWCDEMEVDYRRGIASVHGSYQRC